jgi:hypothetical protein
LKGNLLKKQKVEKVKTTEIPEEYKILNIITSGHNIVINIDEIVTLANTYNESEVLASMNKACSYYHSFCRMEKDLKKLVISKESDFKIWMANKKSEYSGKEYNSEAAKERAAIVDHEPEYKSKLEKIANLQDYVDQANIAKHTLEKHVDMIRSIGGIIKNKVSDPNPTSESDSF